LTLRTIEDLGDLSGKRVLVRVDFNVPLENGKVADDFRIRASLPTITELLDAGAQVILASHLGRPNGKVVEELRMAPVAESLTEALAEVPAQLEHRDRAVTVEDFQTLGRRTPGVPLERATLLENLRFDPGEEANDPGFAERLASLADAYVDDAFGAAHRAHASVVGVAERLPSAAGRLMQKEIEVLSRLRDDPEHPYVAILGGAKISDKLGVLESLIGKVDAVLVGGAMAFTLLAVQGAEVGDSLVEPDRFDDVKRALKKAEEREVPVLLPEDVVAAADMDANTTTRTVPAREIPRDLKGLDIGPRTVEAFAEALAGARTILWNGPMGVFELEPFAAGTLGVARAVAGAKAFSVVGGGDSLLALRRAGLEDSIDHLSTGGGASLEFIEGRELPGVQVLEKGN
jgi:phosphoglycerate kinase